MFKVNMKFKFRLIFITKLCIAAYLLIKSHFTANNPTIQDVKWFTQPVSDTESLVTLALRDLENYLTKHGGK